jgi:hypothetical protein
MPYEEITDVEPMHTYLRWYLRLTCTDRTFETIPCNTYLSFAFAAMLGPPRAMGSAEVDIRHRLADSALPASDRSG